MTKRFLGALALLITLGTAAASERRNVVKTEHFDVIYGPRSADTAALIAAHADDYAREICSLLGTELRKRIPVYIESDAALLNAWYSPYPYDHIVLLDTMPTDGDLAGNTDSILAVFYHELTHAVSLSIRTPFWQFVSSVVGDFVSVNSALTMPLSFMEGVTVSLESRKGEGRLQDPAALHLLQQDKLEGRFLSWKESAGALDVYPAGRSYYLYGGFFAQWLQRTRGMELYANFWNKGASFNPFTSYTQTRFRQVYGESLDQAWRAFEESIPLPPVIEENPHLVAGTSAGVHSLLDSRASRLVWLDLDSDSVMLREANGVIRPLLDADGTLNRLSLSADGSRLLLSGATLTGTGTFDIATVFDIDAGRYTGERYPGLRDAAFLDDGTGIVAVRTVSQKGSLVIVPRSLTGGEGTLYEGERPLLEAGPGTGRTLIVNPVDSGNGTVACIEVTGTKRALLIIDHAGETAGEIKRTVSLPFMRYLSRSDIGEKPVLAFSWSSAETFYRAALFDPETELVRSQGIDYSGGVYYPVVDGEAQSLVYVALHSGTTALKTLPLESLAKTPVSASDRAAEGSRGPESVPGIAFDIYPFSPLPWLLDGVFIPLPTLAPQNVSRATGSILPGFLYITGSPTEKSLYSLNPSFSAEPFFVDYSFDAAWSALGGTVSAEISDHLRPYAATGDAYRDLSVSLGFSSVTRLSPLWNRLDWGLAASGHWYGRESPVIEGFYGEQFASSSAGLGASLSWQAIRSTYIARFPVFAVTRSGPFTGVNLWYGAQMPEVALTPLAQWTVGYHAPFIPISVEVDGAWSEGLLFGPVTTRADVSLARDFEFGVARYVDRFPEYAGTDYDIEGSGTAFSAHAEIFPLTLEIQRGVPLLPLYANRFVLTGGYRSGWFFRGDGSRLFLDSGYGKVSVQGAVIMGALSSVVLTLQAEYSQALRTNGSSFGVSFLSSFSL